MRTAALALVVSLLLPSMGYGEVRPSFYTANQLLTACEAQDAGCYGYMAGVVDASNSWAAWGDLRNQLCMPIQVTPRQVSLIFVKFAKEHPALLHGAASSIALNSLLEAYRCNAAGVISDAPPAPSTKSSIKKR